MNEGSRSTKGREDEEKKEIRKEGWKEYVKGISEVGEEGKNGGVEGYK